MCYAYMGDLDYICSRFYIAYINGDADLFHYITSHSLPISACHPHIHLLNTPFYFYRSNFSYEELFFYYSDPPSLPQVTCIPCNKCISAEY